MSLLIDALKKAEEAKRKAQGSPQSSESGDIAATVAGGIEPWQQSPAGTEETTAAASNAEQARRSAAQMQAARTAFEVKAPRRRTSFALGVGLLTTLASALIALYLWHELQPSGLSTTLPTRAALPPAELPLLAGGQPTTGAGERVLDNRAAARPGQELIITRNPSPQPSAPPFAAAAEAAPAATARAAPKTAPQRGSLGASTETSSTPLKSEQRAEPNPAPVVRRGSQRTVPAELRNAWLAYQNGDLDQARRLYSAALRNDRQSVDALTGLGAIAMRGGREDDARRWFGRALQAQPTNAVALAAMAGLEQREMNNAGESRLRSLLSQRPEAHTLHFALGNILARERRWAEAQASYFAAYDLDRSNPDYLFNVAVSLDRLGKRRLAQRFYGDSLRAAGERPHAFALQAATERLNALAGH